MTQCNWQATDRGGKRTCAWIGALMTLLLLVGQARARDPMVKPTHHDTQNGEIKLTLTVGHSTVVKTPWPVKRVSVAREAVADVQVATADQVVVVAREVGTTNLILWNEQGETLHYMLKVVVDLEELRQQLKILFPDSPLKLDQSGNSLVVRGELRRNDDLKLLDDFLKTQGMQHINMTSLAGVQQVMLKVRIVEASRDALRSLGINMLQTGDKFFGASTIGGNPNSIDIGVAEGAAAASGLPFLFNSATSAGQGVTLLGGFPEADLQFFISALEDNQYLKILAEPTLVALSGEEASFLAGGEFPIPVVQSTSTGGATSISIEFKEFGVSLNFRPVVRGEGSIRLHVAPESSQLSNVGAVKIDDFEIPALIVRRAETTLELKSGQTFAIAGLINRNVTSFVNRVPGLGSLPVLGSLFRSVSYTNGESEMIVLVSAYLVEPLDDVKDRPVPGDLHGTPDNYELYAEGRIEAKKKGLPPVDADWRRSMKLQGLRGPRGWATHGRTTPAAPQAQNASNTDTSQAKPQE